MELARSYRWTINWARLENTQNSLSKLKMPKKLHKTFSIIDLFWFETYVNIWLSLKNPNIFNPALLVGKQCLETNHLFRKCYGSGSLFVSAFHKKTIKIFMNTKPLIRNQMMNHYSVRKTHQHLLCASHVSKSVCARADCYSSTFFTCFWNAPYVIKKYIGLILTTFDFDLKILANTDCRFRRFFWNVKCHLGFCLSGEKNV